MPASLQLVLHDVPEPEALTRIAEQGLARLAREFPSMRACRVVAERSGPQFEVHVELLFPERQVIFNRVAGTAHAALNGALDAVSARPIPIAA